MSQKMIRTMIDLPDMRPLHVTILLDASTLAGNTNDNITERANASVLNFAPQPVRRQEAETRKKVAGGDNWRDCACQEGPCSLEWSAREFMRRAEMAMGPEGFDKMHTDRFPSDLTIRSSGVGDTNPTRREPLSRYNTNARANGLGSGAGDISSSDGRGSGAGDIGANRGRGSGAGDTRSGKRLGDVTVGTDSGGAAVEPNGGDHTSKRKELGEGEIFRWLEAAAPEPASQPPLPGKTEEAHDLRNKCERHDNCHLIIVHDRY
jgi:hypothetical protein